MCKLKEHDLDRVKGVTAQCVALRSQMLDQDGMRLGNTLRGIDFYDEKNFAIAVSNAAARFLLAHGVLPDIVAPVTFNEKIQYRKFFEPLPLPTPGDKLGLDRYIPETVKPWLSFPERRILAKGNNVVPAAGAYWLKANTGSAMNTIISLADCSLEQEVNKLLRTARFDYGLHWGEWWYSTIKPKLFLEQDIGNGQPIADYKFYVFAGKVFCFHVTTDRLIGPKVQFWSPQGETLPFFLGYAPPEHPQPLPPEIDTMLEVAAAVGSQFSFARIDMYCVDGRLYLGEITLSPGDGVQKFGDPETDLLFGQHWPLPPVA